MIHPERNDVDISTLFKWGKKVTLVDINGVEIQDCYVKLIGDAEINRARIYGLRKSAELRKALKNKESDEHLAFVLDIEDSDKDKLVETMTILSTRGLTMKVLDEFSFPQPKELKEDATLEEQEEHQKEIDTWSQRRDVAFREKLDGVVKKFREELATKSREELYKLYEDTLIAEMCENEMINRFKEMCVFFGTYKDEDYKTRLFESVDEFNSLPTEIKKQIMTEYLSMELSVDDLKK